MADIKFDPRGAVSTWFVWHLERNPNATLQGLKSIAYTKFPRIGNLTEAQTRALIDDAARTVQIGLGITRKIRYLQGRYKLAAALGQQPRADENVTVSALVHLKCPIISDWVVQVNVQATWEWSKEDLDAEAWRLANIKLESSKCGGDCVVGDIEYIGSTYLHRPGAK